MRGHAPSPTPGSTGGDEPACKRECSGHGLATRNRAAELGAIGPHQKSSGTVTLDSHIRGIARQHARGTVIDSKAEFRRKREGAILQRLLELGGERLGLVAIAPERRD